MHIGLVKLTFKRLRAISSAKALPCVGGGGSMEIKYLIPQVCFHVCVSVRGCENNKK
jgi:hypothetical protein